MPTQPQNEETGTVPTHFLNQVKLLQDLEGVYIKAKNDKDPHTSPGATFLLALLPPCEVLQSNFPSSPLVDSYALLHLSPDPTHPCLFQVCSHCSPASLTRS